MVPVCSICLMLPETRFNGSNAFQWEKRPFRGCINVILILILILLVQRGRNGRGCDHGLIIFVFISSVGETAVFRLYAWS